MKMASWSSVSEHLVNPIGMSDQLKWNNQDAMISFKNAIDYINAHYDVTLEYEHPSCHYSKLNKQCIKERCPYYG